MVDDNPILRGWPLGIDNRSRRDQLPEGAVRDLVNLDAGPTLNLRAGYEQVYAASSSVHGMIAYKGVLLVADGTDLVAWVPATNSSQVLRTIAGTGGLAGAVMNDELFFCTADEALRFDGQTVRRWGVPSVSVQPPVSSQPGGSAGRQLAVTYEDATGVEGGTGPARFVTGTSLVVQGLNPPPGGRANVYMSAQDGTTLYYYGSTSGSELAVNNGHRPSQRVLDTQFETPPPAGHLVAAHNGVLLIAQSSTVWVTLPFRPHAVSRMRGFFQFPTRVTALRAVTGGVYVSADHTYFLVAPEVDPSLRRVYDSPIVEGSDVPQSDNSAVWLTDDGYMAGSPAGEVTELTGGRWAPPMATRGASGALKYDGRGMVVTTLKGSPADNPLAAADYFQSEITRHEP